MQQFDLMHFHLIHATINNMKRGHFQKKQIHSVSMQLKTARSEKAKLNFFKWEISEMNGLKREAFGREILKTSLLTEVFTRDQKTNLFVAIVCRWI